MRNPIKSMDAPSAKKYLSGHPSDAVNLIDVREPREYEEIHIPGATLIPLSEVADRIDKIAPEKPTIVYCRSGNRSAAAAMFLTGRGFKEVYNLAGGMTAWEGDTAVGPWEAGLYHFTGKETIPEILTVAYAMEANLGSFYAAKASMVQDKALREAFTQLARFENAHQAVLVTAAKEMGISEDIRRIPSGQKEAFVEGGWAPEEFLKERNADLQTPREVVEAAMMFEAQAMDLYLRCVGQVNITEGQMLLQKLADQEKEHLKVLSRLLSQQ